jgi:hypothetical protein
MLRRQRLPQPIQLKVYSPLLLRHLLLLRFPTNKLSQPQLHQWLLPKGLGGKEAVPTRWISTTELLYC